jgi:hypothetical protein
VIAEYVLIGGTWFGLNSHGSQEVIRLQDELLW